MAWIIAVAVGETTDLRLLREPMHLASDYIHPYKDVGGRPARCRVRIYLPDDVLDPPVVVCSEPPNNPGGSITNSAEVIAAGVILASELITPWYGSSTGRTRLIPEYKIAGLRSGQAGHK